MAGRKTIQVDTLIEKANAMLRNSEDTEVEMRWGVIHLIEYTLHDTDRYHGFNYLPTELVEYKLREGYDDTRRYYYR